MAGGECGLGPSFKAPYLTKAVFRAIKVDVVAFGFYSWNHNNMQPPTYAYKLTIESSQTSLQRADFQIV